MYNMSNDTGIEKFLSVLIGFPFDMIFVPSGGIHFCLSDDFCLMYFSSGPNEKNNTPCRERV